MRCCSPLILILPTLLGYERYVIVSGSMEPTIPVGAVIYDEVVPVDDIETGDIITFVPPPEYGIDDPVTHRVIEISIAGENTSHPGARLFQTKGDANEDPDAWKMVLDGPDQARYVRHIPYVGYVYMALQSAGCRCWSSGSPRWPWSATSVRQPVAALRRRRPGGTSARAGAGPARTRTRTQEQAGAAS